MKSQAKEGFADLDPPLSDTLLATLDLGCPLKGDADPWPNPDDGPDQHSRCSTSASGIRGTGKYDATAYPSPTEKPEAAATGKLIPVDLQDSQALLSGPPDSKLPALTTQMWFFLALYAIPSVIWYQQRSIPSGMPVLIKWRRWSAQRNSSQHRISLDVT